jgi:putative transposase
MRYRRSTDAGGTYFFTVNLADRASRLLTEHIQTLRTSVQKVRDRHPFHIVAMVVLPDHLHTIWTLPSGDCDYPLRWSLIKGGFCRALPKTETINASRSTKRERGIWQRRYWEHRIRDDADLSRHVDYIHFNPVKHGLVAAPMDWPYSSFHRYVKQGILPPNWSIEVDQGFIRAGEPA